MQCIRCLRQTSAFAADATNQPNQNEREMWWISRWAYGCPMCGGTWVRVVQNIEDYIDCFYSVIKQGPAPSGAKIEVGLLYDH